MAPNLKNISLLSESLLSAELGNFRQNKLNFKAPAGSISQLTVDTESYWEWSSDAVAPVEDVLTLEHIEENLMNVRECQSSVTNPESDSYWAEECVSTPQHYGAAAESANYWDEPSHNASSSDSYWNMPHQEEQAKSVSAPANYWDEAVHTVSESDCYWSMADASTLSESDRYWTVSHAPTQSDAYWNMMSS